MRVLIVEDHPKMADLLQRALEEQGLVADVAGTGEDALWMTRAATYDAVLLDWMLPGIDGVETCSRLRKQEVWAPILMLTARAEGSDLVRALDAGADDYLTKPFRLDELMARLRAVSRRAPAVRPAVLEVGSLRLDPATSQVWRGETEVRLRGKPYALLEAFMRQPGIVLSRSALLGYAWGGADEIESNVIEQHIRFLRERIDRPFGAKGIETVRGAGYRLRKDGG
jgi:two-component system OmpR family response regulator